MRGRRPINVRYRLANLAIQPPAQPNYTNIMLNNRINNRIAVTQGRGYYWCYLAANITAMIHLGRNTQLTPPPPANPINVVAGRLTSNNNRAYMQLMFQIINQQYNIRYAFNQVNINTLFPNVLNRNQIMPATVQQLANATARNTIVMIKFRLQGALFHTYLVDHVKTDANNKNYEIRVWNPGGDGSYNQLQIGGRIDLRANDNINNLQVSYGNSVISYHEAYTVT